MRWVLVDEFIEIEAGKRAVAKSKVPASEYSVEALLIEMMAQAGAVLIGAQNDFQKDMVFAKIEKAEFVQPLKVGEAIEIEASCEAVHADGAWVDGSIRNASNQQIAQARCLLMNIDSLVEGQDKPITFHENFMNHFKIRDKVKK